MKLTNFITYSAAAMMALAPVAASAQAASSYMVVRDGKVVSVQSDSALKAGDRVVTNGSAGAKLALKGCSVDMPAASTVTIGANGCAGSVQSLSMARNGKSMEDANGIHGTTVIVALLALTAVIGGAAAAASGDDEPTSP